MSALNIVDTRARQRVVEAAFVLLGQRGLNGELLKDAAEQANCPLERAQVFFRRDEDLVLALYARLAAELEARVGESYPKATSRPAFARRHAFVVP